jgi:hypothetical protein
MIKNKFNICELLYFVLGFINLCVFWFDNIYNRDVMTFVWLATSVFWFLLLIKHWIKK